MDLANCSAASRESPLGGWHKRGTLAVHGKRAHNPRALIKLGACKVQCTHWHHTRWGVGELMRREGKPGLRPKVSLGTCSMPIAW